MLPFFSTLTVRQSSQLHKLVMTAARVVVGSYFYKKPMTCILNKCRWREGSDMVNVSILKTLHSIIFTRKAENIYDYFKFNRRSTADITTKKYPKSKLAKDFFIYQGIKSYNKLPHKMKCLNVKQFKLQLKKYMTTNKGIT